ncbi:MAG: excinuclease ABC subunit UvrC [Betaproteobacteria bacterium]|nr:excinuclease ABC subunit UvrC [Betaproteobacteria bacterium]
MSIEDNDNKPPVDATPSPAPRVFDADAFIANLPGLPGVYRMLDARDSVLYVGKARDLKKRVSSYFQRSALSPRIAMMVSQVTRMEVTVTRSEVEALVLENNLIKSLTPRYNILFRDDKSYPYLMLSGARFSRLSFHRGALEKEHRYFGPFPHTSAVRESIQLLQRVFRIRTCEESTFQNRSRPCLLYQIKRCSGPCVDLIGENDYAQDVAQATLFLDGRSDDVLHAIEARMNASAEALQFEEAAIYRDRMQALARMSQRQYADTGADQDIDVVAVAHDGGAFCVNLVMIRSGRQLGDRCLFPQNAQGRTPEEIVMAFLTQHYLDYPAPGIIIVDALSDLEEAAAILSTHCGHPIKLLAHTIGDRRAWLEGARDNARRALAARESEASNQEARLAALRDALGLGESLQRIECFDISHTQGEATVASCVVYDKREMRRGEYRHYNIKDVTAGDDYAAMKQVLERRYSKLAQGEAVTPDLVLIDGGRGQMGVARAVLEELGLIGIAVVGVAKGPERKPGLEELWLLDRATPVILGQAHPALHLVQTIRDEAHRFAITGHRARRGKKRVTSSLEGIDGIGSKRRRSLLARFGGLRGVMGASIDDLAQVDGISKKLAEKIHRALHSS